MGLFSSIGKAIGGAVNAVVSTVKGVASTVSTIASNIPIVGGLVSGVVNTVFGVNQPTSTRTPDRQGGISNASAGTPQSNAAVLTNAVKIRSDQKPSPTPVPDPQPVRPFEELPGDPHLIPGTKGLDQNAERYREGTTSWQIQSEPQITPLELVKGRRPDLKPVLWADGVIVKIGDEYICSKRTLADILNSNNPHYDIAENGRVLNRPMGRSVPIIQIDTTKLKQMGDARDRINRYAGVKSVDYLNESELVPGTKIPQGLLNQINWTLVDGLERYPDRFEVWDILASLQANYSVQSLVTNTTQEDGKLDKVKLEVFLVGMDERLRLIRSDFNSIKRMFYNGDPPPGTVATLKYVRVAKTIDPEEEGSKNSTVFKETELVGVQEMPITKTANAINADILETKSTAAGDGKNVGTDSVTGAGIRVQPPDQSATQVAKWQSYGWTVEEAEYLKRTSILEVENPPVRAAEFIPRKIAAAGIINNPPSWTYYGVKDTTTDRITGINRVRWTPAMLEKGKILDPLPKTWGNTTTNLYGTANPVINSIAQNRLTELYGTPPAGAAYTSANKREYWWIDANNRRQAEIVNLAYNIHKIELETGKAIPVAPTPTAPVGNPAIHRAAL